MSAEKKFLKVNFIALKNAIIGFFVFETICAAQNIVIKEKIDITPISKKFHAFNLLNCSVESEATKDFSAIGDVIASFSALKVTPILPIKCTPN